MALYRVTLFQEYEGVQCLNRWNYNASGTPAVVSGSFALASALGFVGGFVPAVGHMFNAIRDVQSLAVSYTEIAAENLYDPVDFYVQPFVASETGQRTGKALSPFNSLGFRSSRVRRDIRRGQKRFVGATDNSADDGGFINAATLPFLTALADEMAETKTYDDEGNTLSFVPVVLGLEKYTTPSGNDAYRPYSTLVEQEANLASGFSWQPYDTIRSQTSRQYGRGV